MYLLVFQTIPGEIHSIVHGHTKTIDFVVGKEILDHLISKRGNRLREIFRTSDFTVDKSRCSVVVKMKNWNSNAEKEIKDEFETFISQYDSASLIVSPEVLQIPSLKCNLLCYHFTSLEAKHDVTIKFEDSKLFITGVKEDVKSSLGRFETMKGVRQKLEKKQMRSSSLQKHADEIVLKYPMFSKESITDWVKTGTSLPDEETISNFRTIVRSYSEKNKIGFFQTEAFGNCRHRILGEFHVALATGKTVQKEKTGLALEVFVGDISSVEVRQSAN